MRLEGKRAIVTGAASGIGRATATMFVAEGAVVACVDRNAEDLNALTDELGASARAFVADLTIKSEVDPMVEAAVDFLGGLEVLTNVAGAGIPGSVHDLDEPTWDLQMNLNVKSIYLMTHAAWPHLSARGGTILNAGSICGSLGYEGLAAYCASKGAVLMLTKCLALDGASLGIRANTVSPGDTETPNIVRYYDSFPDPVSARRRAEAAYPLDRFAAPSEVAAAFAFLASDEARYITGANIAVDGGRTSGVWYSKLE